jgi:replication-associated recombination protein RarA
MSTKRSRDRDKDDNKVSSWDQVSHMCNESCKSKRINEKRNIQTIHDLYHLAIGDTRYISSCTLSLVKRINAIVDELRELDELIGIVHIKSTIVKHILYFIQEFHVNNEYGEMMHIVIQGPPGVGKTTFANIIGKIYSKLNVIKKPKKPIQWEPMQKKPRKTIANVQQSSKDDNDFIFVSAKRSDLIGQYLGSTAVKTQEVINKSLGGVLFIDEAYSLSHQNKDDMYSKECLDTLNQNLSEKKDQFLCIIAGYKEEIEDCFFKVNPGLRRRFPFVYSIEKYTAEDLLGIFKKMIHNSKWILDKSIEKNDLLDFFLENQKFFPNAGGDVELLLFRTKIEHSSRVFKNIREKKWIISLIDIKNGLESLIQSRDKTPTNENTSLPFMYM